MEFDEIDYLERTVEETNGLAKKDSSERAYRRRDRDISDDEKERKISSRRSRGIDEENVREKSRDRDRDIDRDRSSRHRSRDRERARSKDRERRDKDRDVESKERRDREREKERERRDRDKERERERRSSSRSRLDREKERGERRRSRSRSRLDREKERGERRRSRSRSRLDREKERGERRSRSRSRLDREKERGERRSRSRSRSRLDREKERELLRERSLELRESRRFRDKKEAVEPEADPERDQRTVFAYQMPLKANERDVYDFFSKAGKVRDVRLIMDRNSRRSKGVGYIEFYDAMSVPMAIALSGQLLLGQPVMVKPSEAEKNLVQSNTSGGSAFVGPYGATERKLYVGNLHFNMTELQLKQIFEAFGPVELVQLPLDAETGHCKGFGFIQFGQLEHAKAAQSLNGKLEIAGRTIKVSSVTDHIGVQDAGPKTADFDDDEGGGLALNAQSRALLMQKLDRSGITTSVVGPAPMVINGGPPVQLPITAVVGPPIQIPLNTTISSEPVGIPSECLLLKNMFDPAEETEPDFDLDIQEDVGDECSKFGKVKAIHVDKNSAGYVYVRFENVEDALRAQQHMHKRWFARKSISAIFLQPYEYDAKFKGAAA